MKHILIVGGAGYIGTVLSGDFLSKGYKVRVVDNFLYGNNHSVLPFLGHSNFSFQYGDLCQPDFIEKALEEITDVVILAGLVGDPITKKYPELSEKVNGFGIISLINQLNNKGLDRVVFISTCSNYGMIGENELADEGFDLNPLSLYAKSKVGAEKHILSLRGTVDYSPTILRFATAFGLSPRMRFDLTISEFTLELANNHELLIFDANTWRPYCHVKDFSRLIDKVLVAKESDVAFEVFNAGGDKNNFTKQGVIDLILAKLPDGKVKYLEKGTDPRNYRVNFKKVRERLDFEPLYSVENGVNELLNAIENGVFNNVAQYKNFYGNYQIG